MEVSQSTSVFHTVSQGTHLFQCGVAAEGFFSIGDPAALFWPLLPTSEQLHQCNSHCFARNKLASIATRPAGPCASIRDLIVCISLPLRRHPPGGHSPLLALRRRGVVPLAVAALPHVRVSTSNVSTFSSVFSLRYTLYAIPQIPRCGAGAGAQFAGVAQPPPPWPRGQRPAFGHVVFVTACHVSYAFIFSAHRLRRSTLSFMCGGVWCHCTPRSIGSLSCF